MVQEEENSRNNIGKFRYMCYFKYYAAVCGCLKDLLSLLQLTPGLYEFKVIVDGQNAHGEGYVNVTVKPGMLPSPGHVSTAPSAGFPRRWRFDVRGFKFSFFFCNIFTYWAIPSSQSLFVVHLYSACLKARSCCCSTSDVVDRTWALKEIERMRRAWP